MILKIIIIIIALLSLFYLFLNWTYNRQLNKLRRNYNEDDDKSRPCKGLPPTGFRGPDSNRCGEEINRITNRKPVVKADDVPREQIKLQNAKVVNDVGNEPTPVEDKREPIKEGVMEL